ncbi:hypothetical protein ACFL4O_02940 [bacterium]
MSNKEQGFRLGRIGNLFVIFLTISFFTGAGLIINEILKNNLKNF